MNAEVLLLHHLTGRGLPAAASRPPPSKGALRSTQCPLIASQWPWVLDKPGWTVCPGNNSQVPDADVHAHYRRVRIAWEWCAIDHDGETDEPVIGVPSNGRGEDACGAPLKVAGELTSRLVRLDSPKPWQGDMVPIALHPDWAGGKPACLSTSTPSTEARKADTTTGLGTSSGVCPVG
jgi:hypothetical protein